MNFIKMKIYIYINLNNKFNKDEIYNNSNRYNYY